MTRGTNRRSRSDAKRRCLCLRLPQVSPARVPLRWTWRQTERGTPPPPVFASGVWRTIVPMSACEMMPRTAQPQLRVGSMVRCNSCRTRQAPGGRNGWPIISTVSGRTAAYSNGSNSSDPNESASRLSWVGSSGPGLARVKIAARVLRQPSAGHRRIRSRRTCR